jgi:hypothetical protein
MARLPLFGTLCFLLGGFPLLGLAFFSPGLGSEGAFGDLVFGYGLATLALLGLGARHRKWVLVLALFQIILLGLVLFETFSDSALYIGT